MKEEYIWLVTTRLDAARAGSHQYNVFIVAELGPDVRESRHLGSLTWNGGKFKLVPGYGDPQARRGTVIHAEDISLFCIPTIEESWRQDGIEPFMQDVVDCILDCGPAALETTFEAVEKQLKIQRLLWQTY